MTKLSTDDRFWKYVEKSDDCWIWKGGVTPKGYGVFHNSENLTVYAHRFSFEMHVEAIPPKMYVCHKCDNPRCVRPDHLFVGTAKDNAQDMVAKGRHKNTPRVYRKPEGKQYTLTVRLLLSQKHRLQARATANDMTLAGAVRCWVATLPDGAQEATRPKSGGEREE